MSERHRVLRPAGVLHILAPAGRHANAVADPTHVGYSDLQTLAWFCSPYTGAAFFWPLGVSSFDDTASVGLRPVCQGETAPPADVLARFFQ